MSFLWLVCCFKNPKALHLLPGFAGPSVSSLSKHIPSKLRWTSALCKESQAFTREAGKQWGWGEIKWRGVENDLRILLLIYWVSSVGLT